jgi:hypothetical protein
MIDYFKCIQKLHPNFTEDDVNLEDDGNGIIIRYWNPTYGEAPTLAELELAWLDVIKDKKKQEIKEQMYTEINSGTSGYTTQYLTNNKRI